MKKTTATNCAAKAVIYCRVSTKEQTQNLSLSTQERSCRAYCEREGFAVARVFVEKGESAKTADRTKLLELLDYCRENKGTIKHVVVYRIDRFSRQQYDYVVLAARGRSPIFTKHTESVRSGDLGSQIVSDRVLGSE